MIRSFAHKGLSELFNTSRTRGIDVRLHRRILRRLETLDVAATLDDLAVPGFDLHALKGHSPTRYSIHVNGPWCLTFEFHQGDVWRLDFEQYH
jgi:proteic killer suppression protein